MATFQCPQCNLVLAEMEQIPATCSRCGADLSGLQEIRDWVPIARATNLAEAGYLADYLADRKIDTDVAEENEFNAAAGSWYSSFVVRVAHVNAEAACKFLTSGEYDDEEAALDATWQREGTGGFVDSAGQVLRWLLLLLLVVGGVTMFRSRNQQPVQLVQPTDARSFREFMTQQAGPWVLQDETGVRAQLYFNAFHNCFVIKQDLDGDGTLEHQRTFQAR